MCNMNTRNSMFQKMAFQQIKIFYLALNMETKKYITHCEMNYLYIVCHILN